MNEQDDQGFADEPSSEAAYLETDAEEAYDEPYRVTLESTVADALYAVPDAEQIFEQHGCLTMVECTAEHHAEYVLGDLDLVCHIDDPEALAADLNAALEAAEAAWAEAQAVA